MDNKNLLATIASLESKLDLLETEFTYINKILIKCGFPEGIKTLKETVNELLEDTSDEKIASDKKNFN